jgi:hypothetical protein
MASDVNAWFRRFTYRQMSLNGSGDIAVPEQALGKSNKYRKPIPGTATASAALPPSPE